MAGTDTIAILCGWHEEQTPSLHIDFRLRYAHCFGCGKQPTWGEVSDLLWRRERECTEKMLAAADNLRRRLKEADDAGYDIPSETRGECARMLDVVRRELPANHGFEY